MLIDVSHCGDRTTLDGIALSSGPIAITHSNCRALAQNPRNKTDEAIRALAAKGGVMGITGVRNFVRTTEPTNVGHIVDHIEHVARLVGIEHVGIGSDADLNGYDDMPRDQYERLKGIVRGELRVPRPARHRRLRPSAQNLRPHRGTGPAAPQRRRHRA